MRPIINNNNSCHNLKSINIRIKFIKINVCIINNTRYQPIKHKTVNKITKPDNRHDNLPPLGGSCLSVGCQSEVSLTMIMVLSLERALFVLLEIVI